MERAAQHRTPIRWQALIVVAAMFVLLDTRFDRWLGYPVMAGLCAGGLLAATRVEGRTRSWLLYAAGLALAVKLRALAYLTGIPFAVHYPIAVDAALPGPLPSQWLQQTLFRGNVDSTVNRLAFLVYVSYFIAPWIFAVAASWRRPALFRRFAIAHCIMLAVGLVFFFALPTAPPWLANQLGELPGVVNIIRTTVGNTATYDLGQRIAGQNPVAAMPSFHMATIFLIFVSCTFRRSWTALFAVYAASMAFALVYLGEHYVVDLVVGCAIAAAAWIAAGRIHERQPEPSPAH